MRPCRSCRRTMIAAVRQTKESTEMSAGASAETLREICAEGSAHISGYCVDSLEARRDLTNSEIWAMHALFSGGGAYCVWWRQ